MRPVLHLHALALLLLFFGERSEANDDDRCKDISSPMIRLRSHLFCSYDPGIRPTFSHRNAVDVTMNLMPKLLEFDAFTSTMTLHCWLLIDWTDSYLTWSTDSFDDIGTLHISSDEVWVPDLSVYNSGDLSLDQHGVPATNCLLYNTGSIRCVPAVRYVSRCSTDFTYWPYDEHECEIRFGSWTHTGEEIDINLDKKGYITSGYKNNSEWDLRIVNATKIVNKFDCCPNDTFPTILYTFSLKRHRSILRTVYVTPAIAMMFLTLVVLWLDSRSTERVAVACVNFVCHLICIANLHWELPSNGANPPHILLFYRDSLALAVFALILTAVLRKLHEIGTAAPSWVSSATNFVLSNRAGRFLILDEDDSKPTTAGMANSENEETTDAPRVNARYKESSWKHMAAIIESLSLFSVVFAYIVMIFTLVPWG